MAKIYGINGVITGKLGAAVYAVRNGEQISRQYQPIVANPSTPAQVAARAKLKLMSQLSAVLAPYIAMRREGAKSVRNMFVKENYPFATYNESTAKITLTSVQLTKSVVGLPAISATRTGSEISIALSLPSQGLNRVVYVAVFRQSDGTLRAAGSTVATTAGSANTFPAVIDVQTSSALPIVVYAYGVRDNTEAARVTFANMTVDAENVANVIATRTLTEADVTLTETSAVEVAAQA